MMTQATDRSLAELARRLAGRLILNLTTTGPARSPGVGRLVTRPADAHSDELDLDSSIEGVLTATGERRRPSLDDLQARHWTKPDTAICLLVDRSGSMDGTRLATAALAAAACTWRAPADLAVLAFSDRVLTIKDIGRRLPPRSLVATVLGLRGHGTTDIALALEAAGRQIGRSRARRKLVLLLSDGESTTGVDPVPAARRLNELAILAPADEPDHATDLARRSRATLRLIDNPMDIVSALNAVLT